MSSTILATSGRSHQDTLPHEQHGSRAQNRAVSCWKFGLKGVGSEYADLLEAAGVDSCPELAQRNATNLAAKLAEINAEKSLTRRVPTETMVADWIAQAKDLPKVVTH
jgi:hypothetical protein